MGIEYTSTLWNYKLNRQFCRLRFYKITSKKQYQALYFVYDFFTTLCHQTISKYETVWKYASAENLVFMRVWDTFHAYGNANVPFDRLQCYTIMHRSTIDYSAIGVISWMLILKKCICQWPKQVSIFYYASGKKRTAMVL